MSMMTSRLWSSSTLLFAIVLLVAVNVLANRSLTTLRLDLTETGLYTLSSGTRQMLANLDEPITLRFYLSQGAITRLPGINSYAGRIRGLLEELERAADGKLNVHIIDPEPFSEKEDRAVGYGLNGIPMGDGDGILYFGIVGTNTVDNIEVIPFLSLDREEFLEYDIAKLLFKLSRTSRTVVGLMSDLPIDGGGPQMAQGGAGAPPWMVIEQIRQLFDVEKIPMSITKIPANVDLLMVVHPKGLSAEASYAIDQFVLAGGNALVFVDPHAEADNNFAGGMAAMNAPATQNSDLPELFKAWGLRLESGKVVGELASAARVRAERDGGIVTFEYPVWMNLDREALNADDIVTAELGNIALGSPGRLVPLGKATTVFAPLIETSTNARLFAADRLAPGTDPQALLDNYQPGGERLVLAARISGPVITAFPDGAPVAQQTESTASATSSSESASSSKSASSSESATLDQANEQAAGVVPGDNAHESPALHLTASKQPVNIIVVADTDMLQDQFWVQVQNMLGTRMAIPISSNGDFVANALDNLTGSADLISIRKRGSFTRPFRRVNAIRQAAEARFREKEQELSARLEKTEEMLVRLQEGRQGDESLLLSVEQQAEIGRFRDEKLRIRKDLRDVRHELRASIENLGSWLKFLNIAAVPILIGIGAMLVGILRARRRNQPQMA